MTIPHFDFGGTGPPLHFVHANGYPPDCYKPFFEFLKTEYHVFGMKLRPLWPNARMDDLQDWIPLSEDLLRFLSEYQTGSVIGVGHSIGGIVTLRAALLDPQKFGAIVLLDPVLFMPSRLVSWNLVRTLGMGKYFHPWISATLKRRRSFDDLDLVFRGYRTRERFKYLSDKALKTYIAGIAKPKENGGYELAYTPEWEAHIYLTGLQDFDLWRGLPRLEVPTLIIRGAESDTFLESAARLVKRKQPRVRIEALSQASHLVPLEKPQEVFEVMQSFLKENP